LRIQGHKKRCEMPTSTTEQRAATSKKKAAVAALSVASNSVLIAFKLVVGIVIGSVAVISEAIHSGMDLAASVIAFFAVRASGRTRDERHPYGHGKFENVSGVVEALLIFAAAAWIIYEAVHKLVRPQGVEMPVWGVAVMAVSVVLNIIVSRRLFKVGRETDSIALQADAIYTSAGVMLAMFAVMIGKLVAPEVDLSRIDAAAAILVALLILRAAVKLTWDSARDLLDVSLPEADVSWIGDFISENWPVVKSFHNLQTRKAGPYRFIDFHLVVEDTMSVAQAHTLGDEIVEAIKTRLPETRVLIHIEPCDFLCKDACISGCAVSSDERDAGQQKRTGGQGLVAD
jgi:cation diffusion facilitator family transporter